MDKKGIIDRIEDDKTAVILVETENSEYVVPKKILPGGAKEGSWLSFTVHNQEIINIEIDQIKTAETLYHAKNQLDRIRKKSKGSKFKRK